MAKIISGEELRSSRDLAVIATVPRELHDTEQVRQQILEIADRLGRNDGRVTVGGIMGRLRALKVAVPWKNPPAVIGTILTRSGKWERHEDGYYASTEREVTPPKI